MSALAPFLSPQVAQAIIAGLFLAIGWWVNGAQNRRRDAMLRAERVRDVQRAVFAEIRAYLAMLRRGDLEAEAEAVSARIKDDPSYFPIIPTESNDAIFRAIIAEIHVLPRDTIDPIVLYYRQLHAIDAMIADLRMLDGREDRRERAAAMAVELMRLKTEAQFLGEDALAAILANLDGRGTTDVSRRNAGRRPREWV